MALLGTAILILVTIIFLLIAFYVVKNIAHLVINAIIGLITLFIVNFFTSCNLPENPISDSIGSPLSSVLLTGLPGAILLIILSLVGITL
jgi:inhibitor of the pro-sigma K processing machinery